MNPPVRLALALVLFALLATANSGGYRYAISDQAFYIPAIALRADPELFPRDRGVFEPQMRLWLGDEILGAVVRHTGVSLPMLFAVLHVLTLVTMGLGAIALARALGANWWTIAAALVLLTLRHRIARTGANSLEGYMHPRMLAFGLGLFALAAATRARALSAAVWTLTAAVVHTSTALWFGGAVLIAMIWQQPRRMTWLSILAGLGAVIGVATWIAAPGSPGVMDAEWLAVLADRDYLFSLQWPAYAWLFNFGYVALLAGIHWRRVVLGVAIAGESALCAGLVALVLVFVATLPFTAAHVTFFVQLQANRVFWLLDAVAMLFVAWLLMEDIGVRWTTGRRGLVLALLIVFAGARGIYVLRVEADRSLAEAAGPSNGWTEAMRWLQTQPKSWHVLADPAQAWRAGSTVRASAFRDTPLDLGKDPAMAMYDRALAMRVADRKRALVHFDAMTPDDVRALDAVYDFDVFIDVTARRYPLPELFRNAEYVVYDLR